MLDEVHITPANLVAPLFYQKGLKTAFTPSPYTFTRHSQTSLLQEIDQLYTAGVRSVLLFEVCDPDLKSSQAERAIASDNGLAEAISLVKKHCRDLIVMSDVALDAYTTHGHDGLIDEDGQILNDETVEILTEMARLHAQAGVDFVAPSDMMDGRIAAIRRSLDRANFREVGIVSYSAKYASSYYGPFRDTLGSGVKLGDKKSYQLHPCVRRGALAESLTDAEEGADILMVKPALHYLDIISDIKASTLCPIAAYHVSGEYFTLKAAAAAGVVDFAKGLWEATCAIKRAGADLIFTYGALPLAEILKSQELH